MADGRVTGRHRLTIDADLLSQPSGDARLRIRELDAFGADAAVSTQDPALPGRSLPRPSTPREIPTARGSTCNRVAIPPILPCCEHFKREHHPVPDGHVGSRFVVQAAEQTAHSNCGRRRPPRVTLRSYEKESRFALGTIVPTRNHVDKIGASIRCAGSRFAPALSIAAA